MINGVARTPPDLRLCSCGHGVGMHGEDPVLDWRAPE